jgi:ketosteroid isomerase-like protein
MTGTHNAAAPHFATAGVVLEALTVRDFARLASAVEPDGTMDALVPSGLRSCCGRQEIRTAFEDWFGDTEEFHVADASVGNVGPVLQLRWRLVVRKPSRGDGQLVVEQQAFARMSESGLVQRLSLVCSGFQVADSA